MKKVCTRLLNAAYNGWKGNKSTTPSKLAQISHYQATLQWMLIQVSHSAWMSISRAPDGGVCLWLPEGSSQAFALLLRLPLKPGCFGGWMLIQIWILLLEVMLRSKINQGHNCKDIDIAATPATQTRLLWKMAYYTNLKDFSKSNNEIRKQPKE